MNHDDNVVLFAPFGGVAPDPELFLASVLDGWERQQRSKDFSPATIRGRRVLIFKLVDFSGHYPWEWTLGDADEFFSHARGIRNLSHATVRAYQAAITRRRASLRRFELRSALWPTSPIPVSTSR